MGRNINIVELKESHLHPASEIYNHYIENSTATFNIEPVNADGFREVVIYDGANHVGLTALDGESGDVIGYGVLAPFKSRCAYRRTVEVSIYLHPDNLGSGIGESIYKQLEEHARSHNIHVIVAEVCSENESSINFFRKLGYEETGILREIGFKFGRYLDVTILQKKLEDGA